MIKRQETLYLDVNSVGSKGTYDLIPISGEDGGVKRYFVEREKALEVLTGEGLLDESYELVGQLTCQAGQNVFEVRRVSSPRINEKIVSCLLSRFNVGYSGKVLSSTELREIAQGRNGFSIVEGEEIDPDSPLCSSFGPLIVKDNYRTSRKRGRKRIRPVNLRGSRRKR